MSEERWVTVKDLMGIPGLPTSQPGVKKWLDGLCGVLFRKHEGQGGGNEYALRSLKKYIPQASWPLDWHLDSSPTYRPKDLSPEVVRALIQEGRLTPVLAVLSDSEGRVIAVPWGDVA